MKIGVFDSGVGGLSVAQSVQNAFPQHEVAYRDDRKHVPYGTRLPAEILGFVIPIFRRLEAEGCRIIVIACNTVSTTLIDELRSAFPNISLVGVEPMVEQAAVLTKNRIIAVCATSGTLKSRRYTQLKQQFAAGLTVLEPDCSDWAQMIENDTVDISKIAARISVVIDERADVIVLGCTHYHWIEEEINVLADGRASVLQPEAIIISEVRKAIATVKH